MPTGQQIDKELASLRDSISEAKTEDAELGGRIKASEDRLKEEFGAGSLKAAEKLKATEMIELEDLEAEFESKFTKLKEEYEW